MNTKQVIVMRKDLNMRKGKMCAQASHASMAFLTKNAEFTNCPLADPEAKYPWLTASINQEIKEWMENSFTKICVYVNSEQELIEAVSKANEKNLIAHLITDNGLTEFGGVPTITCAAIGPAYEDRFEGVTSHLPLL